MKNIKTLLLGSGAREHALAWAINRSSYCDELFIAPGNGGTDAVGTNVPLTLSDHKQIADFIVEHQIDLLVVGPEQPLVAGLRDYLTQDDRCNGLGIIGPGRIGAQLEGSKAWSKAFMHRHKIPTAASYTVDSTEEGYHRLMEMESPYVLKADGLAAGKGVLIINDIEEAKRSLSEMLAGQFGVASSTVVLEEFLTGTEVSVFALTDGSHYILWPEAKDYKRIGEGDTGLNTGGMGSVSPVPLVDGPMLDSIIAEIIDPTIDGLRQEGIEYVGFIFFGLILTPSGPKVIEYNARMGDPETQVVVSRLQDDVLQMLWDTTQGLSENRIANADPKTYVNVVLASGGYPQAYEKGKPITLPDTDQRLFHAGTARSEDQLHTSGGRVLSAVAHAPTLEEAIAQAMDLAEDISFDKKYYRRDIGRDLL